MVPCCNWLLVPLMAAGAAIAALPVEGAMPDAWDLVHPEQLDGADREQRRHLADDLLSRVRLLAAALPAQSPAEEARVRRQQEELSNASDQVAPRRRARLYLAPAYQQRQALDILEGTVSALRCARDSEDLAVEMVCWARASAHLLEEERLSLALGVLRDARMMPRDRDMPVMAQDPLVWYGAYGRGILALVVIPHLETVAAREGAP